MEEVNVTAVDILGGLFIGDLLTALCFGIMTIQTSTYYRSFPNDGRLVKLAVCFLWVLGAFQLACVTRSLYWWLVTNSHNPLALGRVTWEFTVYQINAVCASVIVQTFFSHRVYYLSGNPYIGVLVQVLVLFQFGFGATCIVVNMNLDSPELLRKYTWLIVTWLTSQAIADVVIAACMSVLLRHRRTGFQKADSVINRMVLYTICTGLITSVLSCFLLVLVAKDGFDFSIFTVLAISMPLGTVYSITMLTNLHMRTKLRARWDTSSPLELIRYSITKIMRQNAGDHGTVGPNAHTDRRLQGTGINVTTVVHDNAEIRPMNSDTRARSPAAHSPVLGET